MIRSAVMASAALAVTSLLACPAHATISWTTTGEVSSDPGQPGSSVVDDFNGTVAPGVTLSAYSLPSGETVCDPTQPGCNAQLGTAAALSDTGAPQGLPADQQFLAVSQGTGVGFAVINFSALSLDSISFYWGSVDEWNTVQLLTPQGNLLMAGDGQDPNSIVTGTQLVEAACGNDLSACGSSDLYFDHAGSQRITFSWDPDTDGVGEIEFIDSPMPAFEIADVTGTPVPEPSTGALMLSSLTLVPATLLRRRRLCRA